MDFKLMRRRVLILVIIISILYEVGLGMYNTARKTITRVKEVWKDWD